jgi:hypothetical protein
MARGSHSLVLVNYGCSDPADGMGVALTAGPDLMRILDSKTNYVDRRKRARLALSWTVYLSRQGSPQAIEAKTKNVSCEGFYCVLEQPFTVGELVHCTLEVPTVDPGTAGKPLGIDCHCKVVRVEFLGTDTYGVAFHMPPSWRLTPATLCATPPSLH